jgi:hypothetical protein
VEQVRKELARASLLAMALAAGLGTMSYALFAGSPPAKKLEPMLDTYTTKGGIGIDAGGGLYEPGDNVAVYAHLTVGGIPVNGSQVTFTVRKPNVTETVETVYTNDSGVAEIPLSFLLSEGTRIIGDWRIMANASANNEAVDDMITLRCKSENARIEVSSKRNGAVSNSFLPDSEVFLEARLSYRNTSIADAPVSFEVKTPNDTDLLSPNVKTVLTDKLGTANITFRIPWPSGFSLGTWQATVTSRIYEQNVNDTTEFDCQLVPPTIDVYTDKGGQGQNVRDGTYMLNETIVFYAQVRGSINQTLPNNLVSFEIKFFNVTSVPWTQVLTVRQTNALGIANTTIRTPPIAEYVGTWAVYVTVQYGDTLLIDTLIFTTEQP